MFENKSEKDLKALNRVVQHRLSDLRLVEPLVPHMERKTQGWVKGQIEVYEEILGVLEGQIVILQPAE